MAGGIQVGDMDRYELWSFSCGPLLFGIGEVLQSSRNTSEHKPITVCCINHKNVRSTIELSVRLMSSRILYWIFKCLMSRYS